MAKNLPIYDGDSLFLYCSESAGHLYCEPQRYLRPNLITVCTASDDKKSSFPNIEFAAFTVSQIKQKSFVKFDQLPLAGGGNEGHTSSSGDPMTIVYGSAVKLRHKVSNKYLSITTSKPLCLDSNADPDECIFHLVSPTQEKGWGEDLTLNCLVKFESVKYKGYRIQCVYNTMEASYRLVLSATGSVFSLKPHCHKRALLNSKSINGGSVIMLASIKVDGYISATGSFANEHLLDEFKSKHRVGLRRWHKEFYKVIPYSGDTYLQIEKLIDLNSGSPFMYGEECRIKHIPTQQYITFFGTSDGFEISLQSLQTSCDHELFRILSVDNSMTEQTQLLELDKIVLQHVKSEKMLSIYVKPVLQKNIHASHHSPRSQWFHLTLDDIGEQTASKSIFQVLKVEDSAIADVYDISGIISSFCSILQKTDQQISDKIYESHLRCFKSLLNKSHEQKNGKRLTNMFRIFQGVDAMISILMKNKHNKNNYKVCESICSALEKYIGVCNKKSRMYMTKGEILDALFDMIGEGFGIKTVLIALCKDDVDIRDQLEEKMSSLIEQTDTHDHDIAELMTTLAFNKRRHSREIQNLIYRKTLESGMIHDFPEVKFVLEEFVLRCEYLEQIGIAADRQPYTFNYDSLSVYLSQQEKLDDDDLQKIEENIRQYLLSSEIDGRIVLYYTRSSEYKDRNSIIAQMLGVLVFLIDYGFYHNKETKAKEMINILIKILDGSTDSYDRPNSNERDYSSESKIIFKIKLMSLHCLQLFLKRHCYTSLKKLLYDYKVLNNDAPKMTTDNDDSQDDSQDGAIKLNQVAIHTSEGCDIVGPVYDPPHKKMMDLSLSIEPITEELTKISQERLRYNFHNSHYQVFDVSIYSHQNKKLCDILIDLMNYEDPEICLMSAELLYDMHSIETTLLSVAERVYFYSNDDDQHNLSGMLDISTMTDEEQLLKKMLKRKVDDVPKLLKKLKEFSALCVSANEEPNPFYQGVAYSCGLFNILLEYILEYGNSNYFDQEEIMSNCCLLLQSISRKYPSAQKRLFASLHDLMNVKIAVTPMVYLLNEIFIENPLLCECLTEGDIKQMFYIATSSSNPEHFELTVTLETILRAINASTPMKEYIIQLFSEMWEDNLGHIYGASNKNFKLNLLKSPESDEANLNLLLNSSDLLATCTEGECYSAESLVSLLFPITDLLEIISCDEIVATHHKLPFARILTWTYLNTDRDSLAACSQLASSDLFWSHLEDELSIIDDKVLKSITFLNPQQRADLHTKNIRRRATGPRLCAQSVRMSVIRVPMYTVLV